MPPQSGGGDRRVRRTRRAIREALIELCTEQSFGSLTVEDLLDRADVARATFYAHYRAKEDILVDIVRSLTADRAAWMAEYEAQHPDGFTGDPLRSIFTHAEKNKAVYRVILQGAGDGRPLREFYERTSDEAEALFRARAEQSGHTPRIPVEFVARAWAGELIGALAWWLEHDTEYTADQVATMLSDLSARGRRWAAGPASG
ncbi:TetR family transcriptional regulator [Saccharopolyspora erythraea NRRL 2338]|uniref:TetR-family transcriptional regulator n=1 Tax=Saccharopolyspora erythraea (strain ATCC 11635 / DSM 40517 / JCM 4748 / NBRC 13426 / NCIMB 8594 / NRRL 2338) TaxID=405948 RepID=A4FJR3_SACEN|nr:TetR/AcrR family transcriptional regulator [Saccharopolyspora erythraea]EQD86060.1 TetR family transcriptional regulator [Saccharopolyspora erythraea D]PFG97935.1 TetR family transcriptional regulator [Saccharopolyspora erythraea NRRL 2338]QRK88066.1 TetR/AcrR family transcriptional regulator [Saccharopolyspora erythraea]CAM04288.1 TetR-family transcriptional regulator [Saccharopolyspora erythraea NRRL 2338]